MSAAGTPPQDKRGRILGRVADKAVRGSLVWLTIEVPGWPGARPGQFALLQAEPSRCFLARALSISDEDGCDVSFLVDPIGEGTRELCDLSLRDDVWVLGPLGNGFPLEEITSAWSPSAVPAQRRLEGVRLVVVGGGVGVAPFPLLLSRVARILPGPAGEAELVVLLGFRDESQAQGAVPVEAAVARAKEAGLRCRLEVVAEDGSRGPARKVTDLVESELQQGDKVVVCGPPAMSGAVWRVCAMRPGVRTWFSLEANMACGVGSCHGCVIALADGSFARVCHEGPVFPGEMVYAAPPESVDRAREPL
jgi:dihydroorotate dehydrogenase electron transfer subunit